VEITIDIDEKTGNSVLMFSRELSGFESALLGLSGNPSLEQLEQLFSKDNDNVLARSAKVWKDTSRFNKNGQATSKQQHFATEKGTSNNSEVTLTVQPDNKLAWNQSRRVSLWFCD